MNPLYGCLERQARPFNQAFMVEPQLSDSELMERAARIKLLLMDVDGVLTDGKIQFAPDHEGKMAETKAFDAQDGIALRWLNWYGIKTGVISGRDSQATVERARQVGMTYVFQGHIEKVPILEQILKDSGLNGSEVAYVGDDLTDVVIMRRVGLTAAPANARPEVKQIADMVTQHVGGSGAVRDVIEVILRGHGLWNEILKKYEVL
jgi:3-deoxy-D-manno-octulosonate 8-phosphate phosphatase (KDO 8-P phosphatase)